MYTKDEKTADDIAKRVPMVTFVAYQIESMEGKTFEEKWNNWKGYISEKWDQLRYLNNEQK